MSIRTKQSLAGFVATDPELTFTSNGDARVYMRVGQPQARFEQDGTFTQLDPEYTDLVMFRKYAELAHEPFRKGDNFVAKGETRIYTVDRGTPEHDTPQQEAPGREQVQQQLAQREADLDPEPPAASSASSVKREAVAR